MLTGFLTIKYDDNDNYKSLLLELSDKKNIEYSSGDPLIDWYEYKKFIYGNDILYTTHSSSIDDWFFDNDDYVERYLDDDFNFISYSKLSKLSIPELSKCLTVVCHKDMKNFEELKEYYKNNKK